MRPGHLLPTQPVVCYPAKNGMYDILCVYLQIFIDIKHKKTEKRLHYLEE